MFYCVIDDFIVQFIFYRIWQLSANKSEIFSHCIESFDFLEKITHKMRELLYLWILLVSFFDCEISVRFCGVIFMSDQYNLI